MSLLLAAVYVGAQALLAAGTHADVAGSQSGVAGALLLRAGVQSRRAAIALEGIPPISLPQRPSAFYGQATPQISLLDGTIRFALDPASRLWLGAGMTVVNQRTPLPNLSQVVSSRFAGIRYELLYRRPLSPSRFLELTAGASPLLQGSDHFAYSNGHPPVDKPETAAEIDATAALGFSRGNSEWLVGFRTLNFSARFSATSAAADRNAGSGLLFEWRQFLTR